MSRHPAWWKSTEAMVAGILALAMVLIGLVFILLTIAFELYVHPLLRRGPKT